MATEQQLREYLKRATVELAETRKRLERSEQRRTEPIAVVGMSCRYPGGADSVDGYWDLLRRGGDAVVDVPLSRWDMDDYFNEDRRARGGIYTRRGALLDDIAGWDAEFFRHSPQEALRLDPQQRLLAELVWEALEDAGTPAPTLAGQRVGVLVGFLDFLQYGRLELERVPGVVAEPHFGQGVSASVVAGRIAYQFDLRGPTFSIDTACSSSLIAVHLAAEALRRGECEMAVAAGVSLVMHPDLYIQACSTSMLAADGACKTFDSRADGYVMGEGGGVVVLERLSSALRNGRPIRAVIRGSATNQDGRSNGLTAPSRSAQADVIRRALDAAGLTPDEVDYVEAHGSGTRLGDAIELSALHDVFGGRDPGRPLRVGAVKTNIGHTLAAAGIAGLIKSVLCLENGVIAPNLHFGTPARAVPSDGTIAPVGADPRHTGLAPKVAGVSAFGWSGSNVHVVLAAAPTRVEEPAPSHPGGAVVLPCSAASPAALRASLDRLATHLTGDAAPALTDVAHTLRTGRAVHDHRRAVICADATDLAKAAREPADVHPVVERPRVAFLLPGVGDQHAGLGADLYRTEPVYAAAVDRCVTVLLGLGVDLRPLLDAAPSGTDDLAALIGRTNGAAERADLDHADLAHPFLFTVEYALAALLADWGVTPDVLVGYSLGEYVAACLAGVFSLPDALRVVVARARLIGTVPPGRMLAVAAGEDRVRAVLREGVTVAALNGPAMTVLSGLAGPVDAIAAALARDGVACRPLQSAHAFHSPLLTPVRDELAALIESVPRHAPRIDIVSNSTGRVLTEQEATSADYWADHLVHPVRFADGLAHCRERGVHAFVELGAGQTLGGLVRQGPAEEGVAVLGTLPARWTGATDTRAELLRTCGRLWEIGVDVDWAAADRRHGRLVPLPTYPFQRTAFWPEPTGTDHSVPRRADDKPANLGFAPVWRQDAAAMSSDLSAARTPLVIFADAGGVGALLASAAQAAGRQVVEVRAGTGPAHYREVFAACGENAVDIVHLWSLDTPADTPGFPTDDELRSTVGAGYDSLLAVVRALGESGPRQARLLTVSRGAVEILGRDAVAPHRALAHGFGRAVRHEYPDLTWRGVDLDPEDTDAATAAAQLATELATWDTTGGEQALLGGDAGWRRGRRWTRDWVPVDAGAPTSPWRPDGTYLITGGTRGLGLALAGHLVAAGVRRLALVGRTPPVQPDSVAALEAAGAEVLLLTADAGKPAELRRALRRCREHFGALHGVIHAAGQPAGGLAQRRDAGQAAAVLAPKVLAMGPLAELVGPNIPPDQRLELLVLYSSAVTAFGGIGESDYCAANTVLDACGAALAARAPSTRVLTVAWGPWRHDAWQASALADVGTGLADQVRAYRQRWGFPDEEGCAFLDRLAGARTGVVLAVRQPLPRLLDAWSAMTDIGRLADAAVPARAQGKRFPRPRLRTEFAPPRTPRETAIAEVWGSYLGIDQVGIHDPFFDLGGNSLLGLAMVLAVERELGLRIPPATLFEHPTVAAFAAAFGDPGPRQHRPAKAMAGSARGERRRRARNAESEGER